MSPKKDDGWKKLEYVSKKKVRKCLQKIETLNLSPKKRNINMFPKKQKRKNPSLWELLKIRNKQAAHTGA